MEIVNNHLVINGYLACMFQNEGKYLIKKDGKVVEYFYRFEDSVKWCIEN